MQAGGRRFDPGPLHVIGRGTMRLRLFFFAIILVLSPRAALGQTAEDSARAVLETARVLERDGRTELARDLLRYLRMRWPGTEAAREAVTSGRC